MIRVSEIRAVCYADIFDFPLTKKELQTFQIAGEVSNAPIVSLVNQIQSKDGYYYLFGRENIIKLRLRREKIAHKKFERAKQVASFLQFIPTIEFIAVTGGLAMNNSDESDDIDFFIVSSPGTLWTTRFLSICFLEIIGERRRPKDVKQTNTICLNMFTDSDHFSVPKKERDLFSAHEVVQAKVLIGNDVSIQKFYKQNAWIMNYLPGISFPESKNIQDKFIHLSKISKFIILLIGSLEFFFQQIQLWYMKSKRTHEVIKDGYLRFHPKDARSWILQKYHDRLRKMGIG